MLNKIFSMRVSQSTSHVSNVTRPVASSLMWQTQSRGLMMAQTQMSAASAQHESNALLKPSQKSEFSTTALKKLNRSKLKMYVRPHIQLKQEMRVSHTD